MILYSWYSKSFNKWFIQDPMMKLYFYKYIIEKETDWIDRKIILEYE